MSDMTTALSYTRVSLEAGVSGAEILSHAGTVLTKSQEGMVADGYGQDCALSASIVRHVCGEDQRDFWKWFASPSDGPERDADLVAIAKHLACLDEVRTISYRGKHKRPKSERGKIALAISNDFEHALDFIEYDDAPWRACSLRFVLPLALIVSHRSGLSIGDVLGHGPYPERRGELLYWKQKEPVDFGTAIDEQRRETWRDFGAIEEKEGRLLVYHYLGYRWQAPLLCVADVDAFEFLERLDLSWRLVEENVDAAVWRQIVAARESGRVEHVVVYDSRFAGAAPDDLERASQKYQVNVTAEDLFKV